MKVGNFSEVGGNHYERFSIEPVHIIAIFSCNWFQGEALNHISRFLYKSNIYVEQVKDLKKAIHILNMAKELDPPVKLSFTSDDWDKLELFKHQFKNDLSKIIDANYFFGLALTHLLIGNWDIAINSTLSLLNAYSSWYAKNH